MLNSVFPGPVFENDWSPHIQFLHPGWGEQWDQSGFSSIDAVWLCMSICMSMYYITMLLCDLLSMTLGAVDKPRIFTWRSSNVCESSCKNVCPEEHPSQVVPMIVALLCQPGFVASEPITSWTICENLPERPDSEIMNYNEHKSYSHHLFNVE